MKVIYPLITDLVIGLHFLWILFLMFGFYFVLKRSRIAYIHGAGLLFALILNLMGWYCPLTSFEDYLHSHHVPIREKSFIGRNIERMIYPQVDEWVIRGGTLVFIAANGIAYVWVAKRSHIQI